MDYKKLYDHGYNSIFDALRDIRKTREKQIAELERKLGRKLPEISVQVIGKNHELRPNDNIGDIILEEFCESGQKLEASDREIGLWYFAQDYRLALRNAEKFIGVSQIKDIEKEDRIEYMKNALKLCKRANKSLLQAMVINGNEKGFSYEDPSWRYLPFEKASEQLADLRDQIYITWEFPQNGKNLHKSHQALAKEKRENNDPQIVNSLKDLINEFLTEDWSIEDANID